MHQGKQEASPFLCRGALDIIYIIAFSLIKFTFSPAPSSEAHLHTGLGLGTCLSRSWSASCFSWWIPDQASLSPRHWVALRRVTGGPGREGIRKHPFSIPLNIVCPQHRSGLLLTVGEVNKPVTSLCRETHSKGGIAVELKPIHLNLIH